MNNNKAYFKLTTYFNHYSVKPFPGAGYKGVPGVGGVGVPGGTDVAPPPPWEGRAIATHKLRLVEFSAFVEHPRDPDTVSVSSKLCQAKES